MTNDKKKRRRPRPPVPVARFRVYAWRSSLYYVVNVWATKKDLHANRRAMDLPRVDCAAHVAAYDVIRYYGKGDPRRPRKRPILGEINLWKRRLGAGVLSHECFHATMSLLRRIKYDFRSLERESVNGEELEEIAAMIQGEFVRNITIRLYALKLM